MKIPGRCWLIAVLFCPLSSPAGAPPELLQFAKRPDFRAPRVSPDGRYLAVVVGREDRDVLLTMGLGTMDVTAEVSVRGSPDVLEYAWTGNDRLVVSFGKRSTTSGRDFDAGGEIFAINADKSEGVYLFGNYPAYEFGSGDEVRRGQLSRGAAEILDGLPDDPGHLVLAVYRLQGFWKRRFSTEVFKVDAYSGERVSELPVPGRTFNFLLDREGRIRVATGVEDDLDVAVYYRSPGESAFRRLGALSGSRTRYAPAAFDDAGNAIYLAWAEDPNATGMARYTPATDELDVLWEGRDFDAHDLIMDWGATKIIAMTYYSDKREYVYFDEEHGLSRLLASIQHRFPDDDVVVENFSRDQSAAVVSVGSAGKPEDYYLADVESMQVEHLFNSRAAIDKASLGVAEHFEIESRDGTNLRGYVVYPPGEPRENLPMVVLPYTDMLGARHYDWFDPDVQVFASRGYAVLQVNHRGSTGYGIAFVEAGYRNWGTVVQDDITDAVRWIVDRGVADPERICIVGRVFGAYSALMSAAREPGLYACAIAHNGIYDLPLEFGIDRLPNVDLFRDFVAKVVGSDDEELARQSPVGLVEDIRAGLLITYDRFRRHSPPAQSKALMKALDRAGIDYERYAVQQRFRGIVADRTREAHYRRMLEFVDAHIGARASRTGPSVSRAGP